jgi:RND family efflux transporter MFP subunit
MSNNSEQFILVSKTTFLRILAFIGIAGFIALATSALYIRSAVSQDTSSKPLSVAVKVITRQSQYSVNDYFTGRVEPYQTVDLAFEQPGKVASVLVDEGDRVQKGAIIATMDTQLLEASRTQTTAALHRVKAQLDLAILTESRQKKLWEQGHSTEQRYDEARLNTVALQAQLSETEASLQTVGRRMADVGGVLNAGMVVVTLLENNTQQARISLPTSRASMLKLGQSVSMVYNGITIKALVAAIRTDLNQSTRTQDIIFNIQSETPIPFGELVDLVLVDTRLDAGYWVPTEALVEGSKGLWNIFVIESRDGVERIARRSIEVIHAETSRIYISANLGDQSLVVASGTHRVVPGQSVTTIEQAGE